MLAPIRCECGICAEWTMIELQGEIDVQGAFKNEMQNLRIGILCQTPTEKPILRIGYHELEGSRVVLKKALAVLRKIKLPPTAGQQIEGGSTRFDVVGVIRQKYLFKTRPRPLISKPEPKLKKIKAG
ncbi:hypothetical protein KFL_003880060 [Klebsormidium nitens]|uniref:Uncharacterized protein n=1 Tax=Klebsormidium nitens TaxID=105231 RepID=A0A1Y1IAC8_KLENI|nr:hypothetical protein KFL_003880060 [Klebsormidium nitens]|eukprot:GAQ87924.1 hypothetical protein KFL_003880060 [Klebsormidium nitens]